METHTGPTTSVERFSEGCCICFSVNLPAVATASYGPPCDSTANVLTMLMRGAASMTSSLPGSSSFPSDESPSPLLSVDSSAEKARSRRRRVAKAPRPVALQTNANATAKTKTKTKKELFIVQFYLKLVDSTSSPPHTPLATAQNVLGTLVGWFALPPTSEGSDGCFAFLVRWHPASFCADVR